MELNDWVALGLVSLIGFSSHFGAYKLGRYLERKELTRYMIPAFQASYDDGATQGLKDGFAQGKKVGLATCDDLISNTEEDGHR